MLSFPLSNRPPQAVAQPNHKLEMIKWLRVNVWKDIFVLCSSETAVCCRCSQTSQLGHRWPSSTTPKAPMLEHRDSHGIYRRQVSRVSYHISETKTFPIYFRQQKPPSTVAWWRCSFGQKKMSLPMHIWTGVSSTCWVGSSWDPGPWQVRSSSKYPISPML